MEKPKSCRRFCWTVFYAVAIIYKTEIRCGQKENLQTQQNVLETIASGHNFQQ